MAQNRKRRAGVSPLKRFQEAPYADIPPEELTKEQRAERKAYFKETRPRSPYIRGASRWGM